jgi:DNA-binding MarR family transcriptional regulator
MEIQDILGYLLGSSSRLIKRTMDNYLCKYNITTSQWAVLKLLDAKIQLTQSQIANELLGDKATVGEIILRLYEKNYIEKSFDKNDRRSYLISLTPKAKNVIKDIEKMVNEVTEKALKGLTGDDMQILYKFLNQIIDNLAKEELL